MFEWGVRAQHEVTKLQVLTFAAKVSVMVLYAHQAMCSEELSSGICLWESVCVQVYDTPVKDWKTQYNDACGRQAGGVAADEDDDMSWTLVMVH